MAYVTREKDIYYCKRFSLKTRINDGSPVLGFSIKPLSLCSQNKNRAPENIDLKFSCILNLRFNLVRAGNCQ